MPCTLGTRTRGTAIIHHGVHAARQRGGTGPWAQGPVPGRSEVVLEDDFGRVVPVSSVNLARSLRSPAGDLGQVLDSIQVPASLGWLGRGALEGPGRASQGLLGGPGTPDPGTWDPDPGCLGPLDPGILGPGSRVILAILARIWQTRSVLSEV